MRPWSGRHARYVGAIAPLFREPPLAQLGLGRALIGCSRISVEASVDTNVRDHSPSFAAQPALRRNSR